MPYRAVITGTNLENETILEKISYARKIEEKSSQREVKSTLVLLSKNQKPSDCSKFYKFGVIVNQVCKGKDETAVCFLLYESNKIYKTRGDIFIKIQHTLGPLLSSGQVRLSEALLRAIILPEPIDPRYISSQLVSLMEQDPEGNPEWHLVIQVLNDTKEIPQPAALKMKKGILSLKQESSFEIMKHKMQVTGTLTAHMVPLLAVPQVALSEIDDEENDETSSQKIYRLSRKGTILLHNSINVHSATKTWLMEAVENEYLQSCMFLLLSGVNPNDQHPLSGDTALHLAVRNGNIVFVKLLLACKADPTIPNEEGKTPLDTAKKLTSESAAQIISVLEEFQLLQRQTKSYYKEHSNLPKKQNSSKIFMLSLDGGGVRGFITCLIMARIESRMKELCPNCDPFQSYFDYVAGTSAGAIIGSALAYINESVQNTAVLMYKFVNEVFKKPHGERSTCLKRCIIERFGESTVMSDLEHQNMIITAVKADISPNKLHLMTNYGEPRDGKAGPNERKLWEALVASASAPTYFPPFENSLMDGGIMANNPTIAAMVDIFDRGEEEHLEIDLGFVLSLGTGVLLPKQVDNIDISMSSYSLSSVVHAAVGLKNLFIHFVNQATHSDGEVVHQAETWCRTLGATYHRMSPVLRKEIKLDATYLPDLVDLLFDTEAYILQKHTTVDAIAKQLLSK